MTEVISNALSLQNKYYHESNNYVQRIASQIIGGTFHHHFHIIWPLLEHLKGRIYLEIGCYAGASLLTALQSTNLQKAIAIDTFQVLPRHLNIVEDNVKKFTNNTIQCDIKLICGSSHDLSIVARAYRYILEDPNSNAIDFLFIDGDHAKNGVLLDFAFFQPLVRSGGLIMFDDYEDYQSSPEVRLAVDEIVLKYSKEFNVIGQPHNDVNAFGNGLKQNSSNEFILQRKTSTLDDTKAKYIICVATYYRKNGTTNQSLRRLLSNITLQTNKDWFLIVIGDRYENQSEFDAFQDCIPREKSLFINLPVAGERDDKDTGKLWTCAGTNAFNYAVMLCQNLKHDCIYLHADDDDIWYPNHLETIDNVYSTYSDASFVWTMGSYCNRYILPATIVPIEREKGANVAVELMMPQNSQTLHSSISWRIQHLPLRYRIVPNYITDCDMWDRMSVYMMKHNLKSYLAKCVTMIHPTENQ